MLAEVCAGDAAAAAQFLQTAMPALLAIVERFEPDKDAQRTAVLYVLGKLKEDGYRRLRTYNSRTPLASFLALVARELLAQRAADTLFEDPNRGWAKFKSIFDKDIFARIATRFPREAGTSRWDDIYQDVCERLIENGCRRLRAYSGDGSFIGFVLTIVDRLLIDMIRQDVPRRRLPAAIKRLPQLEQEIYMAITWRGCAATPQQLVERLHRSFDANLDEAAVAEGLAKVSAVLGPRQTENFARPKIVPLDSLDCIAEDQSSAPVAMTPEDALVLAEEENLREALIARIRASADTLCAQERLYLQLTFGASESPPRRQIAQMLGCSVEEVDRLRQRVQRWFARLRSELDHDHAHLSLTK